MPGPYVLVTGAGRGIGRVVARTLAERGYGVAVNDLEEPSGTLEEVRAAGAERLSRSPATSQMKA